MASNLLNGILSAIDSIVEDVSYRNREMNYERACRKTDEAYRDIERAEAWNAYHSESEAYWSAECARLESLHYSHPYDTMIAAQYRNAYDQLRYHQHHAAEEQRNIRSAERDYRRAQNREWSCLDDYTYWR